MKQHRLEELATELYQAMQQRQTVAPISEREPNFSVDDAYQVSLEFLQHRLNAGEKVIGKKSA